MVEAAPSVPQPSPTTRALKNLVRGAFGLEVRRVGGGVFICPTPRPPRVRGGFPTPCRLHLGCGTVKLEGFVNVDIVPTTATDLVANITRLEMFAHGSVEEIRMDAVYEHLFRHERRAALREWRRVLRPGGTLTIRWIPDFGAVAEAFLARRPGVTRATFDLDEVYRFTHGEPEPWNAAEQIHKDIFTKDSVAAELADAGFEVVRIESALFKDEPFAVNLNAVARRPA